MSRGKNVFIGNLPLEVRERDIEDLFGKYGRIRLIDLKTPPRPPAYCFVEYESGRDAEDAVKHRHGYDFRGNRLRVELARGGGGDRGGGGGGGGGGGDRGGGDRGGDRGRAPPPPLEVRSGRGTGYRAIIKNLPKSASWQDLKDHFRKIVKPTYTNVYNDRGRTVGIVEFETYDDMKYAVRKLDDTEFRNPFDRAYIRVVEDFDEDDRERGRGRSRSRSRSRSHSRSRSQSRSRSRSRSRGRSVSRSRSRSKSEERDRSRSRERSRDRSRERSPDADRKNSDKNGDDHRTRDDDDVRDKDDRKDDD